MTLAKKKAKELIDKYSLLVPIEFGGMDKNLAKQCALIAVDEILESQPSYRYWETYDDETPSAITYWQEVKSEIEKYDCL